MISCTVVSLGGVSRQPTNTATAGMTAAMARMNQPTAVSTNRPTDRFRGQRLLCQRRVVKMDFFYNLAPHQRLKNCVLRALLLQELL